MRQYGREDVEYVNWYSDWSKMLAKTMSRSEIEKKLGIASSKTKQAAMSHLRAVEASTSMQGASMRRAHARNVISSNGDYKIALEGALEIYELFPEFTKDGGK